LAVGGALKTACDVVEKTMSSAISIVA